MTRQSLVLFSVDLSPVRIFAAMVLLLLFVWSPGMALTSVSAAGSIIYVNGTAQGDNDGSSWEHAYTDLQDALHNASSGNEIWVAQGTYTPSQKVENRRSVSFTLENGVAIYGGFTGTETARDQRNPDPATNQTILSGDLARNDTTGDSTENSFHVVRCTSLTNATVLDGFTIRGGNANTNEENVGGGMYNKACGTVLSLANLIFTDNNANNEGGGMYNHTSSPRLSRVHFIGNTAQYGGGLSNMSSNPTLNRVTFRANVATRYGGGMNASDSGGRISNTLFVGNHAFSNGGALYNTDSDPSLINVTMVANTAEVKGGAVDNSYGTAFDIANSILWGNSSSSTDLREQQIAGVSPDVTQSLIQSSSATADPLFVRMPTAGADGLFADDPTTPEDESADDEYGDLRLLPGSPAIDTGSPQTIIPLEGDLAGNTRVVNGYPDKGAYESQGFTLAYYAGNDQSAVITTAFATPLVVQVTSNANEPVSGGRIIFRGPSSGAGIDPVTTEASIDANGLASANVVANQLSGSYAVKASGNGIVTPLSFTLQNDLPVLSIEQELRISENVGVVNLTVSLPSALTVPVTVEYATADGTATAGLDYAMIVTSTLVINPGDTTATIPVSILTDDDANEGNEVFRVVLGSPVYAVLGNDRADVVIIDEGTVAPPSSGIIYLPMVMRSS